eukprot:5536212-Pyramimonas_sp.AAC.1
MGCRRWGRGAARPELRSPRRPDTPRGRRRRPPERQGVGGVSRLRARRRPRPGARAPEADPLPAPRAGPAR